MERVREQLAVLEREGLIDLFEDTQIRVGEEWVARLDHEMAQAKLALLLVSAPFLTSTFIREKEVPRLFRRHQKGGMVIYPLLIRACAWQEVKWLAKLQIRPADSKPVAAKRGPSREECLASVAREIASALKDRTEPAQRRRNLSAPPSTRRHQETPAVVTHGRPAGHADRAAPLLEQLTECFHTHRMMFSTYLRAILNKMVSGDDSFEKQRLDLDRKVVRLVSRVVIYLPIELRWAVNRLRRIVSCSWHEPQELYYSLLRVGGRFPRKPIEAAGEMYDDLYDCYLDMTSKYLQGIQDPHAYAESLERHHLGVDAETTRDSADHAVADTIILEHEYSTSSQQSDALARYAASKSESPGEN